MFDITDKRLVQLEKIYRTYQSSLNFFGFQPPARSAFFWFLCLFLVSSFIAHRIMAMDVHSLLLPMSPFFVASVVCVARYVTFPYKSWDDHLVSLLDKYDASDKPAFFRLETSVNMSGFMAGDMLDWFRAERTALANTEHATRAKAIVERIVND